MLISTASLSLGTVLSLEKYGYKVEMKEDSEWAEITKEDKNVS
jgi:hypothetical protein